MNRFRLLRDTYTNTSNLYGMFTNSSLYNDLDIHLSPPLTPRIYANDSNVLEKIFQKQNRDNDSRINRDNDSRINRDNDARINGDNDARIYGDNEFRIYGDNIYGSWLKELVRPKRIDKKHRIEFSPTKSRLNVMNK